MWEYVVLQTGFFNVDGGAMFGAIPKRLWKEKYTCRNDNTCLMAMNCMLVWNSERVIVLDTGVRNLPTSQYSYYKFQEVRSIAKMVQSQGFAPEQVTDVVLSHLHFDHCGGCASDGRPTFPNARHWVSRRQWETYDDPHPLEKSSYDEYSMQAAAREKLIDVIDGEKHALAPGFRIDVYGGHTEGQLVSTFQTESGPCIFAGDVVPTKAHLRPSWISAYDLNPILSYEATKRIRNEMRRTQAKLFTYHDMDYFPVTL
jgi:glyoxylase-like metal-dependent hydrolase (beta-lactamase superfamily II)